MAVASDSGDMSLVHEPHAGSITVIELHMMNKTRYFPLTMVSGFCIRSLLYPFSVIRTRLQIQKQRDVYNGTYDAFRKIFKTEGGRGLYKGFWISNLLIIPQTTYIMTYEMCRHRLANDLDIESTKMRSLLAGGAASLTSQTFLVPIDIVTQHIMMLGTDKKPAAIKSAHAQLDIPTEALKSPVGRTKAVIKAVYKRDGIRGFYKGYFASLAVYAPNSAMWWFFYDIYCGGLASIAPIWVPRLVLQCLAAPISGTTTSFITNPLDTIRARIQVEGLRFWPTVVRLWQEEGIYIFTKGLSARLVQSITFSFFIILGYETIKRWSLLDEYKDKVRW